MCSICGNFNDFSIFSMIWYCRVQSPAVSKPQDVRWRSFRWSNPLSNAYVCESCVDRITRFLRAHIAYEIDTAKIISEFCRISYCLYDLIRLNSIVCHVQTTRCTDDIVFARRFRYQLTMFVVSVFIRLSQLIDIHIAYETVIQKITTGNWHDARNDLSCRTVVKW